MKSLSRLNQGLTVKSFNFVDSAIVVLLLAILGSCFVISGGVFFLPGQVVLLVTLTLILLFIAHTYFKIYASSRLAFFYLLALTSMYIYISIVNYEPVVFGGQDPGYYEAFGKVLSRGHGSDFDPNLYESVEIEAPYSFWSIYVEKNHSEIEFYPFLPALIGGTNFLFHSYSYVVIAILSNILCVTLAHKFLQLRNSLSYSFIPALWFFIPATLWITRTPASEITSTPLTLLALMFPLYRKTSLTKNNLIIMMISFLLILSRANPLSIILLIGLSTWNFLSRDSDHLRLRNFVLEFASIILGASAGALIISVFQPNFWNSLVIGTYKPFLSYLPVLFVILVLLFWFDRFWANRRGETVVNILYKRSNLFPLLLLITVAGVTLYAQFSDTWGVYLPANFGIGTSPIDRFNHTLMYFILASFFTSIFLLRRPQHSYEILLYLCLLFFILSIALRSPGLPYSYYFQRYWWSEIALILWLLICLSSLNKQLLLSKFRISYSFLIVFLSILLLIFTFDKQISANVEGGTLTSNNFSNLIVNKLDYEATLLVSRSADPSFISQIIIPLRYYFGQKISLRPNDDLQDINRKKIQIISDVECEKTFSQQSIDFQILRLRGVGAKSFGSWVEENRRVFICTKAF
jgi:hypothetical protein